MQYLRLMLRGFMLAVLLLLVFTALTAWRIVDYGSRTSSDSADAALVLGAAAWGDRPSPVFRERIRHAVEPVQICPRTMLRIELRHQPCQQGARRARPA